MRISASFKEIMHRVVEAVQAQATKIPDFDAGTIRITCNPLCEDASEWMGDFNFGDSKCEIELLFPVKPGGSHTRKAGWRGRNVGMVNTYGYSALKVAAAAYARAKGQGNCSEQARLDPWIDGWCDEEHGYAPSEGAVCYEIDHAVWYSTAPDGYDKVPFLRMHVAVSGADGGEDKMCALAAESVLHSWCKSETAKMFRIYSRQILFLKESER